MSMKNFQKEMAKLALNVEQGSDNLVKKIALAADQAVVLATPVDTGRARSNWFVSIDTETTKVLKEARLPGERGSTASYNTTAALARGSSKISKFDIRKNTSINITNNLSYIGNLNSGSSKQAPANYIQKASIAAVNAALGTKLIK